jgi:hypothetical protein
MTDRMTTLLTKLYAGETLTTDEQLDCSRFGIVTWPPAPPRRVTAADVAAKTGCSARTFRGIFG